MENPGLVLTCDLSGRVISLEVNNTGIPNENFHDKLLIDLFATEDIAKVLKFFVETKTAGASFSKQLSILSGESNLDFFFSSVKLDTRIIILGTIHRTDFDYLMTQMMSINNDQTNLLRQVFKNQSVPEEKKERAIETVLYEELSRVNNELVNMQRELAKKNNELIGLNKVKNQFLGMAAHDLRNPLGVIMNLSEIILDEKEKLSEESIGFLKKIDYMAKFMLNLVTDLLDLSSIEAGSMTLNKTTFDLSKLITEAVVLNKPLADKKAITLNLINSGEELFITADQNKIDQVITNLITNAIKFSNPKTTTEISMVGVPDKIRITIKDRGQGIPADELDRLFKPFSKTSVQSTGGEKSTGLGLTIVKKIVEGHNGTITVESAINVGTTFTIELPV